MIKYCFMVLCVAGVMGVTGAAWSQVNSKDTTTKTGATENKTKESGKDDIAPNKPPTLTLPKLASAQIRIDPDRYPMNEQFMKRFEKTEEKRKDRNDALDALANTDLRGDVSANELGKATHAANAVLQVCGLGMDYLQFRLNRNASTQFWLAMASGLFAVGTASTVIIDSAKAMGLTSIALSNYKSNIAEGGDSGHNNHELKDVLNDVRAELAAGLLRYNTALVSSPSNKSQTLDQFRQLQAAVMEMHAACAFF